MLTAYTTLLRQFVALQSVSTDAAFAPQIEATVAWLKQQFDQAGFAVTLLHSPDCNPVVVARYETGAPQTALVYGHYDVQPAPLDQGWDSDPFTLDERAGRLYGRGVVDNKGQILAHMVSVFGLIKERKLGLSVVFVIEGNEETANPALADLLAANRDLLRCDQVLISDGEIMGDRPTLEASLRGGANLRVELRTGATDLHSGIAGGAVPNAAKVLTDLVTGLSDARGKVVVPGFYDGMKPIDPVALQDRAKNSAKLKPSDYGVKSFLSANDTDFYTQTGLYPTLQISGLASGYTGEGFANIVPAVAEARLNLRTVVGQDPGKVTEAIITHLKQAGPDYATLTIQTEATHDAVSLNLDSSNATRARQLLERIYGYSPLAQHAGGAIPVVADFQRLFGVDPLLINLGNDDCNMHGANENFRLDLIEKALAFSAAWFGDQSA